jgi:hypothetical protein
MVLHYNINEQTAYGTFHPAPSGFARVSPSGVSDVSCSPPYFMADVCEFEHLMFLLAKSLRVKRARIYFAETTLIPLNMDNL